MWRAHALSDRGAVRTENEDVVLVDVAQGLFAVVDGFGGAPFAREAAERTAQALHAFVLASRQGAVPHLPYPVDARLPAEANRLTMAIRVANAQVHAARRDAHAQGGATVAALLIDGAHAHVAHAGDARVYRQRRGGALEPLTQDHTKAAKLVARGELRAEDVRFHPAQKGLTLAVGLEADLRPAVRVDVLAPGDRFLLCSDGLTDMVPETRIASTMAALEGPGEPTRLARVAAVLIELAIKAGGEDNVSVVVVEAGP